MSAVSAADLLSPPPAADFGDVAVRYRTTGWLGVLLLPTGQKHPPPDGLTGYRGGCATDSQIATWAVAHPDGNVGLRLPPDVVGLDVDAYHGGLESLTQLETDHGPLPSTVMSTSRTDGSGIRLFRVPAGTMLQTIPAGGIEMVQTHHRYVVAPPSRHPLGPRYRWIDQASGEIVELPPEPGDLPDLPWSWIEALTVVGKGAGSVAATPDQVRGFIEVHTENHQPAGLKGVRATLDGYSRSGRARHDTLVSGACMAMREAAAGYYPADDAIGVLANWWAEVMDDPDRHDFGPAICWAVAQAEHDTERVAELRANLPSVYIDQLAAAQPRHGGDDRDDQHHNRTDAGNALRLIDANSDRFRFVPEWQQWLAWTGRSWVPDVAGAILEAAKDIAAGLLIDALAQTGEDRNKAISFALRTEGRSRLEAMVVLARTDPRVVVNVDQLDADPMVLNVNNGTVDLATGRLRPHDPADMITKLAPVNHDPDATAPLFDAFLRVVQPDAETRDYLRRLAGYSITGRVTEHILPIHHGAGGNGKSVLMETLSGVLGDYATTAEPDLLLARGEVHPAGVAALFGQRFVVCSESDDGRRLGEATVKRLTGGDQISARRMRENWWTFTPSHTLHLLTNHPPVVRGTDPGIWRRLRVIPWPVVVPVEDQDQQLTTKLGVERSGILNWLIAGCREWQSGGLADPASVILATESYKAGNDVVGNFITECCTLDDNAMVAAGELFTAFTNWCSSNGEKSVSQKAFGATLTERGYDRAKVGKANRWHWIGLQLEVDTHAV